MARKSTKPNSIDLTALTAAALIACKCAADYHRLGSTTEPDVFQAAWNDLPELEQQRLTDIVNINAQPDPQAVADELAACGTLIQLQAVKAHHRQLLIKSAWKLLNPSERDRLIAICKQEQAEPQQQQQRQPKTRSLFSISDDLEKLNELLSECGDDAQQQELINHWFEQLGEERDIKLDAYAALISEMQARAEVRKAEMKRLAELAATDENRAKLLKDRLRWFFETHNLKTVETPRYKLSIAKNGGNAPLILKDGVEPDELPEQFQKLSIDPDTSAIREALERGEKLDFAQLGERSTSIRIK